MPRNSNGVYELPAGNPVISGTIIESEWANGTMDDIAEALTQSLPRNGTAPMTGPLTLSSMPPSKPLHAVSKSYVDSVLVYGSGMPIGFISPYAGGGAPIGWLRCDGTTYQTTDYPQLYSVIGTIYGGGTGTFKVPDLRGEFIRGVSGSRVLGSKQPSSIAAHNHAITDPGHSHSLSGSGVVSHTHSVSLTSGGGGAISGTVGTGSKAVYGPGALNGDASGVFTVEPPQFTYPVAQSGDIESSYRTLRINAPDHTHMISGTTGAAEISNATGTISSAQTGVTTQNSTGTETVPSNVAMHYYIKAVNDSSGGGGIGAGAFLGYFDASGGQNPTQKYPSTTFNSGDWYEISVPGNIFVYSTTTGAGATTPVEVGGTLVFVTGGTNAEGWYYTPPGSGGDGGSEYVRKTGDTMTGPLKLDEIMSPDGVDNLHIYGGTSVADGAAVGLNDSTNVDYPNMGALYGGGTTTPVFVWSGQAITSHVPIEVAEIRSRMTENNIHIYSGTSLTDGAAIGLNDATASPSPNFGALYSGTTQPALTWSPVSIDAHRPVMLSRAPQLPDEAATKAYVDAGGGSGGTSDHGALSGLADDDHKQYLLIDGTREMTGPLKTAIIQSPATVNNLHIYGGTNVLDGSAVGLNDNSHPTDPFNGALYSGSTTAVFRWSPTRLDATVPLYLPSTAPTDASMAATKKYVDDTVAAGGGGGGSTYVLKTGDTMTGMLKLAEIGSSDSVNNIHIYSGTDVNNGAALGMNDSSHPTFPGHGSLYAGGAQKFVWNTTSITANVPVLLAAGAPTAPSHAVNKTYADGKVALAGGTMTGLLTLSGPPSAALGAATKQYVDDAVAAGGGSGYVLKAGDTMTGQLLTPSVGGSLSAGGNLHLYGGTSVSNGAAIGLNNNTGTFSNEGALYSGGAQRFSWNSTLITSYLPISLPGSPTAANHAANKTYVDTKIAKTGGEFNGPVSFPQQAGNTTLSETILFGTNYGNSGSIYAKNNGGSIVDMVIFCNVGGAFTHNSNGFTSPSNVIAYSDERFKKDWNDLPKDFLEQLADVKMGTYTRIDSGLRQVGVSAQSLQKVMPEAVLKVNEEGMLGVSYGNAALAACVALAREVQELRARIDQLEGML